MKNIIIFILCFTFLAQGCSSFKTSTQEIKINCSPSDGVTLVVNGQKQQKCPIQMDVPRDKKLIIEALRDGYLPYNRTVDYHLNDTGKLDAVGTAFTFFSGFGVFSAGAWDLNETSIDIVLSPVSSASPNKEKEDLVEFKVIGYSLGKKNNLKDDYNESLVDAKIKAIERAGIKVDSITKVEDFKVKSDMVEAQSKGTIEPGYEIIEIGYDESGVYKILMTGKVRTKLQVNTERQGTEPDGSSVIKKTIALPDKMFKGTEKEYIKEAIAWTEKSKKFAASKNWSEMIRMASVAIQIDPSYPDAYISRSWAYLEKGFPDKALADCQKALELDINNAGAYNNRGLYYLRGGDQAKARDDFEKACHGGLEIGCENFKLITGYKPSEKIAYLLNKAEVAFNAKNWDEVIRCTSEIPDDVTALSVRAGAYAYKGMFEEAIKDCDQAIRINPDYPLPYNNKAFALQLKGNKREALLNYEFACNLKMDLACKNMKALENKK